MKELNLFTALFLSEYIEGHLKIHPSHLKDKRYTKLLKMYDEKDYIGFTKFLFKLRHEHLNILFGRENPWTCVEPESLWIALALDFAYKMVDWQSVFDALNRKTLEEFITRLKA